MLSIPLTFEQMKSAIDQLAAEIIYNEKQEQMISSTDFTSNSNSVVLADHHVVSQTGLQSVLPPPTSEVHFTDLQQPTAAQTPPSDHQSSASDEPDKAHEVSDKSRFFDDLLASEENTACNSALQT